VFGRLPTGASQWTVAAQLVAGGLVSWLLHPLIWVLGPVKFVSILLATAAQESTYTADASGDDGRSVGALQFYDTTWTGLELGDLDRRKSVWWSSWAAAKYIADAWVREPGWVWRLLLPYYGGGYARLLWVNGVNSGLTRSFADMVAYWDSEGAARTAWNTWRVISLPFSWMLWRFGRRRLR